jgi:hypothetical protein
MGAMKRRSLLVALVGAVTIAACTATGPSGDPVTVVRQAMQLVEQGQFEDVADLACADRRDELAGDLGLGQALPEGLPPGLDPEAFASAFAIGTDDLTLTELERSTDRATVNVEGTISVTIDEARLAELIRGAGLSVDDALVGQIVAAIKSQLGEGIPIDEDLTVVVEDGAWKIC